MISDMRLGVFFFLGFNFEVSTIKTFHSPKKKLKKKITLQPVKLMWA